jgi:hypothetical protein
MRELLDLTSFCDPTAGSTTVTPRAAVAQPHQPQLTHASTQLERQPRSVVSLRRTRLGPSTAPAAPTRTSAQSQPLQKVLEKWTYGMSPSTNRWKFAAKTSSAPSSVSNQVTVGSPREPDAR